MRAMRKGVLLARLALALSLALMLAVVGCVACKLHAGAHPARTPSESTITDEDGIDWVWLRAQNPDIVGWLTIPESHVNTPIVRAKKDDPDYYLVHDFSGELNFTGCPYVDWQASLEARPCTNVVITGHNMGWNQEVFGDVASYTDLAWGRKHQTAMLRTPDADFPLRIAFARIIPGSVPAKRTEFTSSSDFNTWLSEEYESATTTYKTPRTNSCIITLATCSYTHTPEDERTIACFTAERMT